MAIPLECFRRVGDGLWLCIRSAEFNYRGHRVQVTQGHEFFISENYMGIDIALELEQQRANEHAHERQQRLAAQARDLFSSAPRRDDPRPETRTPERD